MDLTPAETRGLGCLIEKQMTTPAVYPLSLNSVVTACNQTSNRDPVVAYSEADVSEAITGLRGKALVRIVYGAGQRAEKFRHTLDDARGLDAQHRAVLGVLMLRGPQTVGELRTRTERLANFRGLEEIEQILELMTQREEPLARRLERQPGQKEARWVELMSGEEAAAAAASRPASEAPESRRSEELSTLRSEVAALREEVGELRSVVDQLRALLD
jgi:uncharacterized protein YceH (UPF0502 family)